MLQEGFLILLVLVVLGGLLVSLVMATMAIAGVQELRKGIDALRQSLLDLRRKIDGSTPQIPRPQPPVRESTHVPVPPPRPEPSSPAPPPKPVPPSPALPSIHASASPLAIPPLPAAPVTSAPRAPAVPPARPSMEESLGVQLPVWIGAVALSLAGVFLVKYTFDKGLLTPTIRLAIGAFFGAGLLAAGEWLRSRSAWVAQGLSAAGIADLYACLLAAVNVYDIIPLGLGTAFMVLITAAAVLLALRQGPVVAAVGLVGGFLMPALIHTEEPRPAALFSYLFLLELGLVAVGGRRRWPWLSVLTLGASMLWALLWTVRIESGTFPPGHGVWVGLFLLLSVAAFVLSEKAAGGTTGAARTGAARYLSWAAVLSGLVLVAYLTRASNFSMRDWGFLGILCAGCIVLGRLDPDREGMPWFSAAAGIFLLAIWHESNPGGEEERRYALVALGLGVLHAAGGYACMWGARRPSVWASLSVAAAVGYLLVAHWEVETLPRFLTWGGISLALAAVYMAAAVPVARRRQRMPQGDLCLAALAVCATSCLSLAVPMELEREWISVAWAVQAAALAWLDSRLRLPVLRILLAILAAAVGVRLLLNPAVLEYPIGTGLVWNWLLYGYGVPIAAFAIASRILRRGELPAPAGESSVERAAPAGNALLSHAIEGLAIALGFVLIALEVRHYFHRENLMEESLHFAECGSCSSGWLIYGIALLAAGRRTGKPALLWGGAIAGSLALLQALTFQGLVANPLLSHHPVGSAWILNELLFVYGLPGALGMALGVQLRRARWLRLGAAAGITALVLFFLLVSLEVRQGFQGTYLDGPLPGNAEWYAYSAAWVVFATVLLVVGLATGSAVPRLGSLVVMLAAVAKVFLFDTRELRDLYRVFSFLGLGASLLLLAFLYQRFVFRRGST